ncbi:MAG TPA: ABC transporter ATP-binding protein [Acidimicrobiia bacterium]|nr:ABC transporter ATP-binding protein [Acidimicrobiia bacterium]
MFHGGGWYTYIRYDEDQDRPSVDRALLRRVWSYARPYRGTLLGILVTVLVISGLGVVPPILIRYLIDVAIPNRDLGLLTLLGAGMVLVPLVSALVGVLQRWWSSKAGEGIIFDLRRELFQHLSRMSLRFFTATKTGELMNRLNTDVVGAQQAITGTFVTIISNFVAVVAALVVMIGADWRLTLLALVAMPLFILPARRVARVLRRVTEQQMERNATMSGILQETFNVSGALLVRLFGRKDAELARFEKEAAAVRDLGVRRAMVGRWFFAALGMVSAVGTAAVFWLGGWLVIRGELDLGIVVMFSTLLAQLYGPLSGLSNSRVEFATSLVSFERVFEVLDLATDIPEPENPVVLDRVEGAVSFENVSFRYGSDEPEGLAAVKRWRDAGIDLDLPSQASTRTWALEDLTFEAPPGTLTALVGPSGAGKTTISYLIPRLYDVTEGTVRIDGHDVRDLSLETLAGSIGVVTQETYLFHDTIAANLRYARPDATLEELQMAVEAANVHELIANLPDGFDTVVGERGYRLSGGEKQRLAIARVILKDPQILILDEATSHLDSRSEALIQEALERLMEGRTSIVIAHRLSTVRSADQILVLDEGRLVEAGTHEDLLEADGLYRLLYETQFHGREADVADPGLFTPPV